MILYSKFYKQTGVRQAKKLKDPIISLLKNFQFPKNSFFHYCSLDEAGDDGLSLGIKADNPFLQNVNKNNNLVMFHQTGYSESVDLSMEKKVRGVAQFPNRAESCNLWIVHRTKNR